MLIFRTATFIRTLCMKIVLFLIALLGATPKLVHASDCVILLHGLARSEHSFSKLEHALTDSGYTVINDSYPSTKHDIETLASDFIPVSIKKCPNSETIHFLTHSMGGILVRQYLSSDSLANLGRVVMPVPPNGGSEITDRLKENMLYKLINGPAGEQLGTDSVSVPNSLGPADFKLGVIAGTRSVNPILSTMLPNPDAGKVSVESTRLKGMSDHIELPVSHTFMMRDKAVIDQVIHILDHGEFKKPDQ